MTLARAARVGLITALLLLAACQPAEPAELTATGTTTTVVLAGERLELLIGNDDGMRDRLDFGAADGMLFDAGSEVDHASVAWVMDGVGFPLEIAWFDGTGRSVGRTTMATCFDGVCPLYRSPAPYRWAIEAPVGAFDDLPADALLEIGG